MGSWRINLIFLATLVGIAFAQNDHTTNTNWAIDFGSGVEDQDVDTSTSYSTFDPVTGDFYLAGQFNGERDRDPRPKRSRFNSTEANSDEAVSV